MSQLLNSEVSKNGGRIESEVSQVFKSSKNKGSQRDWQSPVLTWKAEEGINSLHRKPEESEFPCGEPAFYENMDQKTTTTPRPSLTLDYIKKVLLELAMLTYFDGCLCASMGKLSSWNRDY